MDLRAALKNAGASRIKVSPGDVCLIEDTSVVFPETPDEKRTIHPDGRVCVVLSSEDFCRSIAYPILSIAPVTHLTHLKDQADFPLSKTHSNGLHQDSIVMLGHIQPVRKADIFKKIGELSTGEWDLLSAHLLNNLGLL